MDDSTTGYTKIQAFSQPESAPITPDATHAASSTSSLSDDHATMLRDESAIDSDVIQERGYTSLTGTQGYETLRSLGFTTGQAANLPGLLLPVWGTDGTRTPLAIYRPDTPRLTDKETPRKYEFPRGRPLRLDVPPRCHPALGNPAVPLWIVEGQKKGDALASQGACVLVVLGVDCWRGANPHGGTVALPDWDQVALNARQVMIAYDSDLATKRTVRGAMRRLANFLKGKGALVTVCHLPPGPTGKKQGIDDFLMTGHTLAEALALLADPWDTQAVPEKLAATADKAHLPKIRLLPGQLETIALAGQQAILDYQARHGPLLFQRAGRLCFITRDQASERWLKRAPALPVIQLAPLQKLRALLCMTATWWRYDGRRADWAETDPPTSIAHMLLEQGEWPFPPLNRIATRPFLRPGLTLCQTHGYDSTSGVFLEMTGTPLTIPAVLDQEQVTASLTALLALWKDFPFATERDQAAALAALLTLIARPAIDGCCPLFAVVSSTPGSGKGLLADLLCLIATGDCASRWAVPSDEEEMRKQLMTIALAGDQVAMLDNVQGELGDKALDMALTSGAISGRLMGTQQELRAPWTTVLFATGNNIAYRGDTQRRVVQITLQPKEEHPEERTDFAMPDIRQYVRMYQHDYLQHALTILLAYIAEGAPPPAKGMGSFEAWNALIRGCVLWATGTDPLEGQTTQVATDPDIEQWREVLTAWWTCLGAQRRTVRMLAHEVEQETKEGKGDDAWKTFREALGWLDSKGDGWRLNTRVIGRTCVKWHNRFFNGLRLVKAGEHNNSPLWKIEQGGTPS